MAVSRSASLTRGLSTGQTTGMQMTTYMSTTPATAITCTTGGIPGIELQSVSTRRKVTRVASGRSIVHITGSPSTATGSNAAATTATAFRKTVIVATLVR